MSSEDLQFKIALSGTYHDKTPSYSILIDDTVIKQGQITAASGELEVIEFTTSIADGDHSIKIRLENKESSDTIKDDAEGIINDMLLNIKDIEIDSISLGQLVWSGEYLIDEPQEYNGTTITKLDHCVNLGWNGTYVLNFSSPFYIWLLESL